MFEANQPGQPSCEIIFQNGDAGLGGHDKTANSIKYFSVYSSL